MTDPMSTWAFYTKCEIMEMVIGLGFEQDLYQPYEFGSVFL
jgi:hypothetical protein